MLTEYKQIDKITSVIRLKLSLKLRPLEVSVTGQVAVPIFMYRKILFMKLSVVS